MKKGFFYNMGLLLSKWRWPVIIIWLLFVIVLGSYAPKLASVLTNGGFSVANSPAEKAKSIINKEFSNLSQNQLMVLHKSDKYKVSDDNFKKHVTDIANKLSDDKRVKDVITYIEGGNKLISKDKDTAITIVLLKKKKAEDSMLDAPEIAKIAKSVKGEGIADHVTGEALIWKDFSDLSEKDLARAEMIGLPIAAIALFFAFGSLVASGLPLILAMCGLAISFGILFFVAQVTSMNMFVQNISAMIGLGLGIDYSLLIVSRFREELGKGINSEAVARTMNTAGRAVLFSGIAVIIAISGLWVVDLEVFQDFAIGISVVAVVTVFAALTLLPAMLSVLGKKINAIGFGSRGAAKEGGLWQKWAFLIMGRPFIFFLVSAIVLIAMAWPVIHVKLGQHGVETMPSVFESKKALNLLEKDFGKGQMATVNLVIKTDGKVTDSKNIKYLKKLEAEISKEDGVKSVEGVTGLLKVVSDQAAAAAVQRGKLAQKLPPQLLNKQVIPVTPDPVILLPDLIEKSKDVQKFAGNTINDNGRGSTILIKIQPNGGFAAQGTRQLVKDLRKGYMQKIEKEGFKAYVGGGTAEELDFTEEVFSGFPKIFALVLSLTFLILLFVFRSLILPIKAVIVNAISVFAAYGILVTVFQFGIGDNLIGFDAPGVIGNFTPIILFCIIFGLSMDYEVFLLSRVKEVYEETKDNSKAVAIGLEKTGRIITSAAFIMISVFAGFALTSLIPVKEMGFGMAVAILLDASLVRIILVPATMQLMGKWNWWIPKWLDKLLPKIKVD